MRVFGFGSGMDIDSIVKEIMTAKRAPLDKLKQRSKPLNGREKVIVRSIANWWISK